METDENKPLPLPSDEERDDQAQKEARHAVGAAKAEEDAIDAAIRRSISLHGA
jgi:hypothetical protein